MILHAIRAEQPLFLSCAIIWALFATFFMLVTLSTAPVPRIQWPDVVIWVFLVALGMPLALLAVTLKGWFV